MTLFDLFMLITLILLALGHMAYRRSTKDETYPDC